MEAIRVAVAGGSIGGLTAAVLLHEQGHDVHVFERSSEALQGRGAGIVVLPMTERYFTERGTTLEREDGTPGDVALTLTNWSYVDREGTLIAEDPTHNRFSSWNTIYRALRGAFADDRYHLGHQVTGYRETGDAVWLEIADHPDHEADLMIVADGVASTIRPLVEPAAEPRYTGYVAWRGTVLETDLPVEVASVFSDAMLYQVLDHSHVLVYAIPGPGDTTEPGSRALNFVWYRNYTPHELDELMTDRNGIHRPATMPPGLVADRFVDEMRTASADQMAPQLRAVIEACPDPFIQVIFDMKMERFVHGRVAFIGDAACALRPHVAAGTAKACADGWAMARHFSDHRDQRAALAAWEREQMALADRAMARTKAMGVASQVDGVMRPGDPEWRFGLFGPGN